MGDYTALYVWLAVLVIFALLEGATVSLHFIWFAFGAVAALIVALFSGHVYLQILAFAAVAGLTLAYTRPFFLKVLKVGGERTNADRFIGETGVVTEKIDNLAATGLVNMRGQIWTARSTDDAVVFTPGDRIVAERIEGVKLFVHAQGVGDKAKENKGEE